MGIVAILNLGKKLKEKVEAKKQEEVERLARQKVQEIMETGKPEEYVQEEKAKKPIKKYLIIGGASLAGLTLVFLIIRKLVKRKK